MTTPTTQEQKFLALNAKIAALSPRSLKRREKLGIFLDNIDRMSAAIRHDMNNPDEIDDNQYSNAEINGLRVSIAVALLKLTQLLDRITDE